MCDGIPGAHTEIVKVRCRLGHFSAPSVTSAAVRLSKVLSLADCPVMVKAFDVMLARVLAWLVLA